MKLVAVVLSGGSGSRLWPLSTDSLPKPFLPLFGEKNLLEKTLHRLSFLPLQATLIVTNQKYYSLHKKSQKKINNQKINQKQTNFKTNFLLEPVSKNTAPAVLMAAHWKKRIILVKICWFYQPDHLIFFQRWSAKYGTEPINRISKLKKGIILWYSNGLPLKQLGAVFFDKVLKES